MGLGSSAAPATEAPPAIEAARDTPHAAIHRLIRLRVMIPRAHLSRYTAGAIDTSSAVPWQETPRALPWGGAAVAVSSCLARCLSMKQTIRFRVDFTPGCSLGPGKIELL